MKNVIIYIRVSTLEQAQHGFSIDEQKQRLSAYCEAMGWNVVSIVADPGHSGKDLNRPGIQKILKELKNFDVLAIYKLDRLSRSQKDTLTLIEDHFLKNNIDIVSLQEHLDTTTSTGRMMIGILSAFAQLERETFKERSLLGRTGRARQGKWVGTSRPPIGYDYDKETKKLLINPYEAEQVKKAFTLYLEGMGVQRIAETMHAAGHKHKYGDWSFWGGMLTMLSNPVYIGKVKFNGELFDGLHEPIIAAEVFDQVQARLESRKIGDTYKRKSPFSFLLHCGNCGARMFLLNKHTKPKYYCYSRYGRPVNRVKDRNCKMKIWNADEIDARILKAISLLSSSEFAKPNIKKPSANEKVMQKRIADINKQIDKLIDLYQISDMPIDNLNSRIDELQKEKQQLIVTYDKEQKNKVDTHQIKSTAKTLIDDWNKLDIGDKTVLLKQLIKRIDVHPENIDIIWAFDLR